MRGLWLLALCMTPASAYLRSTTSTGSPLRRTDADNIRFLINQGVKPAAADTDGLPMITADSDPVAALRAAAAAWSGVAASSVRFAPPESTPSANDSRDNQHVIVVLDTDEARSIVGSALAVTLTSFFTDGRIVDSDIIFNPRVTTQGRRTSFSTTLADGTFDLQAVATHELGHALGAGHSGLISACMFASTGTASSAQGQLSSDDIAFAADAYPAAGPAGNYGTIAGAVSLSGGGPVGGALLVAVDSAAGVTVGGLSAPSTGAFSFKVPAGQYQIYAEPLKGAVSPGDVKLTAAQVNTDFTTSFLGGRASPTVVSVAAGGLARADLTVASAPSTLTLQFMGTGSAGGSGDSTSTFRTSAVIRAGQPVDLLLIGQGLDDTIVESDIRFPGGGVALRSGSLRLERRFTVSGLVPLRITLDVSNRQERGVAGVIVSKGSSSVSFTGSLSIVPPPGFTAAGVGNVASYQSGGVSPGEIVAIFGTNIGPAAPLENKGYDPSSERLPSSLGGVRVTFDGIPAPLFFVSANQVNAQVPYELAGRQSTRAAIRIRDVSTNDVNLPVLAAHPGLFLTGQGTQAIVVHPDGSLNSAANPVAKGTAILLFATGPGVVAPAVETGKPASTTTLSSARNVSLTIGGANAAVLFAGPAPGFTGLMQINAVVPDGAASGGGAPVLLTVQGAAGVAATMAVR